MRHCGSFLGREALCAEDACSLQQLSQHRTSLIDRGCAAAAAAVAVAAVAAALQGGQAPLCAKNMSSVAIMPAPHVIL